MLREREHELACITMCMDCALFTIQIHRALFQFINRNIGGNVGSVFLLLGFFILPTVLEILLEPRVNASYNNKQHSKRKNNTL